MTDLVSQSPALRARVLRGLLWKVLSQLVLQFSKIAVALVLARLLTPHDYGIAGMVLVFSTLVFVFSDLGLGAALVQRPNVTQRDRSTVFWTSAGVGLLFTVVGIALAGPIAAFYGESAVRPLVMALSLSFFVTSLGTTQAAMLTRAMDFRGLELRVMAGALIGGAVGVVAAAKGYGAWAIILQQLAGSVVSTALLWRFARWRPGFEYSRATLRRFGGFSANVFGTRLLFYVSRNADNILIGRFIGPAALGAYALAYNVMLMPFDRLAGPVQEVLFPAFAQLQDERDRMGTMWLRVNRVIAAVSLPLMIGLIVVTPDFVHVVLGDRWHSAIPVIRILACVGFMQSLVRLNSSILLACDRAGTLFRWSILITASNLAAFGVGLHWGIVGVATGYAITNTLLQPVNTFLTGRAVDVSLRAFGSNLIRPHSRRP